MNTFALRSFLQIMTLLLTLEAALFLARGNLKLTPETIASVSGTSWGFNRAVVSNLAAQAGDTWAGVVLLLAAFSLQMVNALWPIRIGDFSPNRGGMIAAIVVSLLVGAGMYAWSNQQASATERRVHEIIESKRLGDLGESVTTSSVGEVASQTGTTPE